MNEELTTAMRPIEDRLLLLEKEMQKNREFRQEYYKNQQERVIFETQIRGTISSIDEKLDKLISWQENQVAAPGKRWNSILEKIGLTIVGAIVGAIMVRLGFKS